MPRSHERKPTLKYTLRTAAIIVGLGALTALGACSQPIPDATPTRPVTATPTPTTTPTPSQTSTGPLREADTVPGLRTLSKIGPTTGSQIVGRIQATPGALVLTVICRGNGKLVVALEPMSRITVPCGDGKELNRTVDQLTSPRDLKIMVAATGDVQWSLRAQQ